MKIKKLLILLQYTTLSISSLASQPPSTSTAVSSMPTDDKQLQQFMLMYLESDSYKSAVIHELDQLQSLALIEDKVQYEQIRVAKLWAQQVWQDAHKKDQERLFEQMKHTTILAAQITQATAPSECSFSRAKVKTKQKKFSCPWPGCNKQTINLKRHVLLHAGIERFACSHCKVSAYDKRDIERHFKVHIKYGEIDCETCKSFVSQVANKMPKEVLSHIKEKHPAIQR